METGMRTPLAGPAAATRVPTAGAARVRPGGAATYVDRRLELRVPGDPRLRARARAREASAQLAMQTARPPPLSAVCVTAHFV